MKKALFVVCIVSFIIAGGYFLYYILTPGTCDVAKPKNPDDRFPLVVETSSGTVEGREGKTSLFYKGIPYAEPPVGRRRWQPPVPKMPWKGVLKAHDFSNACPQIPPAYLKEPKEWDEDCLCLNIYRPVANAADLPVVVYIHGGAFIDGAGSLSLYDGEWLAQQYGIVLVTINYRLRELGFLYLPEAGIAGNYGLRDQIQSLEWVRDNISAFGGSPDNVTVVGESAGGISIGFLLALRPDLFQKAIIQSGYINMNTAEISPDNASRTGQQVVKRVGCGRAEDLAACLRETRAADFLTEIDGQYRPVIDGKFITGPPLPLIINGRGGRIPLIMGHNADEGGFFVFELGIESNEDYKEWVSAAYPDIAENIMQTYPATAYKKPRQAAAAVFGDMLFACPTRKAMRKLSAVNPNLYQYFFTYAPFNTRFLGVGSHHGAELYYLFHTYGDLLYRMQADRVARNIAGLWAGFAHSGTPAAGGIDWPVFNLENQQYLEIADTFSVGRDLLKEECDVLDTCEDCFP